MVAKRSLPGGSRGELVMVPREAAERIMAKTTRGRALHEWILYGIPHADLRCNAAGEVVQATFTIGVEVPGAVRVTHNAYWRKDYKDYCAWKDLYREALRKALSLAGYAGASEMGPTPTNKGREQTLFGPRLSHEPLIKKRTTHDTRPLVVHLACRSAYKPDWDNRIKAVMDVGNRFLWPDDFASAGGTVVAEYAPGSPPLCVVTVQAPAEGPCYALLTEQQAAVIGALTPPGSAPFVGKP